MPNSLIVLAFPFPPDTARWSCVHGIVCLHGACIPSSHWEELLSLREADLLIHEQHKQEQSD